MSGRAVVDDDHDHDGDDEGPVTEITVFLIVGAGLLALFAGADWFWIVWVVGFAAVLPIVSILEERIYRAVRGGRRPEPNHHERPRTAREDGTEAEDALETLKRRYAEGEIDDVEFERRLERLVENESVEDVERRVADTRDGIDRELERER